MKSVVNILVLERALCVYLKAKGEVCNRLNKGVRVHVVKETVQGRYRITGNPEHCL